jgi:hypothetical protein
MILKCRAWMIKEKAMVRVAQLPFLNEDGKPENYAVGFYGEESESGSSVDYTDLGNVILMQSTGFHDAMEWCDLSDGEKNAWKYWGHTQEEWNGREIYEGDIVQWWGARRKDDAPKYGVVSYVQHEGGFGIKWKDRMESVACQCRYVIVVGNIYQNSDLLSDWGSEID